MMPCDLEFGCLGLYKDSRLSVRFIVAGRSRLRGNAGAGVVRAGLLPKYLSEPNRNACFTHKLPDALMTDLHRTLPISR